MSNTTHVTIAILNWNGASYLKKYLPFFLQTTWTNFTIVVIDNASTDDSRIVVGNISTDIEWIQLTDNHGFTGGYNKGLQKIRTDGVWAIVNSDIEVTPNWLEPLVEKLESDPLLASVQPIILDYQNKNKYEYAGAAGGFIDLYGYPFCRGRIFSSLENEQEEYQNDKKVFWSSGACMVIKPTTFWEVGGFDERFFAHMEEIDFCWRLQNMGYYHAVCSSSKVYHVGGGTLAYNNPKKTYLNFRNNTLTLLKNLHPEDKSKVFSIRFFLDIAAIFQFLVLGKWQFAKAVFNGITDAYKIHSNENDSSRNKRLKDLEGMYPKSIVWSYYIKSNKKFSDLNF